MKIRISTIIGIVFLIISVGFGVWLYHSKGGFNEVEIEERGAHEYTLFGKEYDGSIKDEGFEKIFADLEKALKKYDSSKYIMVFYEHFPDKDSEFKTRAVIGVVSNQTTKKLFEGDWGFHNVKIDQSIYGVQQAGAMVTSVYSDIADYAEKHQLKLSKTGMIEHYYSSEKFGVEIPFSPKTDQ